MKWHVLGPVGAATQERAVPLARPQQRGVLAYLLLNADTVVSIDRLTTALWGDAPPATARTQIHACVSQIRRALRTVGEEDRLLSEAGGYRIAVAAGELDLADFRERVRLARTAAADGRFAESSDLLREGLACWRGTPLAGAAGVFVAAAATDLAEQQLLAQEELADAEIALARYGSLVPELRPLVAAHPMRERLVGQFMIALAGSGQQAQALQLYNDTRVRLDEELGVEPGPDLAQVHLRVLRQEWSLPVEPAPEAGDRAGPRPPRPPRPAQLPAAIAGFVGRARYLDQLDQLMADGPGRSPTAMVVSAVAGAAGVGKSTLAVHWAHLVADKFPDGQLYADLRGFDPASAPVSAAEVIREFLDGLGVSPPRLPASLPAQAALYRSLLADRQLLIVLDNARDADQVRPLLPGSPGCLVLVTSRNQLPGLLVGAAARPLTLGLMTAAEARDLLEQRIGADRVLAEPAAVDDIVDLCAGLPLALAIVAARAVFRPDLPLAVLVKQLRDAERRLDALSGGDTGTDLRAVFSWSYGALSPGAARLFRLLSGYPGLDIATPAAASLAGISTTQVAPLLAELSGLHLVTDRGTGRYAMHDLLRVYASELAHDGGQADRRAAWHRLLDHYLHSGYAMDRSLNPHRDPIALPAVQADVRPEYPAGREHALSWFTAERAALTTAVERASGTGFDRHAWQLAWTLETFLNQRGHWHDWADTQQTALLAARNRGDRSGEAHSYLSLAQAHGRLHRFEEAYGFDLHALRLFDDLGDRDGAAHTHRNLGWLLERLGRDREALAHDWHAVNLFRATGHRVGQARALNAVGWRQALLGNYRRALVQCRQALAIQQEIDDQHGQASTWDTLGLAQLRLGHHQEAISCYRRALDLCRRIGLRYVEATTLDHLGDAYRAVEDAAAAHDAWRQAARVLDDLDHPDANQIRAKLRADTTARRRSGTPRPA